MGEGGSVIDLWSLGITPIFQPVPSIAPIRLLIRRWRVQVRSQNLPLTLLLTQTPNPELKKLGLNLLVEGKGEKKIK